jgi:acetyl-CoA carboxylase biotin carboxyl carrier protein
MSEIKAPITGNVWKVLVAVGDPVEVDQMVAILESMKLEIPVESEAAGTVAAVHFAPDDVVTEGDVMFELS